eukprot:1592048-Rhodomonas_salina.1
MSCFDSPQKVQGTLQWEPAATRHQGLTEDAVDLDCKDARPDGAADLGEEQGIAEDVVVTSTVQGAEGVGVIAEDVEEASKGKLGAVGAVVNTEDMAEARQTMRGAEGMVLSLICSMSLETMHFTLMIITKMSDAMMSRLTTPKRKPTNKGTRLESQTSNRNTTTCSLPSSLDELLHWVSISVRSQDSLASTSAMTRANIPGLPGFPRSRRNLQPRPL